ncbi:MOSC domain-containing protein [Janibacter indicus]|uniref:Uncharacterized conserved protein YcbX, contains MOSC and Fe-S domains n=1 Tax=Janibacter indicus TaxID=857417 RepID=A0A1W2D0P9_9MICO|nr:MOSC N-terminal beta barrel domain-containing protein [Janibacter indicus]SMC91109.1 Uncharacterized conserved protein YcbX, contains MOSC and Fe-S domains [Janibacter indicus]
MHITRIGLTPLKGARHADLDHLRLDPSGPRGDRLFCLIEADEDRVLRTVENPTMVLVSAARDGAVLTVTTQKGGTVAGEPVPTGHVVEADYWGRPARLEVMTSDHAELLGDHLDRPVRLAGIRSAGEVVYGGSVSIVTTGALRELGEVQDSRFRATLTIAADRDPEPGSLLRLGEAVVRVRGAVPRCRVVDINTETGELDTRHLHTLAHRDRPEGEVPFGVDADVVTPGVVRREDPVALI